jgi:flagellar hook-length control protein FliK
MASGAQLSTPTPLAEAAKPAAPVDAFPLSGAPPLAGDSALAAAPPSADSGNAPVTPTPPDTVAAHLGADSQVAMVGATRLALAGAAAGVGRVSSGATPLHAADAPGAASADSEASSSPSPVSSAASPTAQFLGQIEGFNALLNVEAPSVSVAVASDATLPAAPGNGMPGTSVPQAAGAMTNASALASLAAATAAGTTSGAGGGEDGAPLGGSSDRHGGSAALGAGTLGAGTLDSSGADGVLPAFAGAMAATADSSAAPSLMLSSSLDSSGLPQELAGHVGYLIGNSFGSAKLQVTPPQLGPIEVSISVQDGRAQILMSAHSAVTREALESSAPQLRELLGAQGFGQVSVDISQHSQQHGAFPRPEQSFVAAQRETVGAVTAPSVAARGARSLVDAYA